MVTGVLGVVFSILSMLGSVQTMVFPLGLNPRQKSAETSSASSSHPAENPMVADPAARPGSGEGGAAFAESIFNIPAWFKPLSPISRWVGSGVAGFYCFASFQLMSMKRRGLRLFQWALGVSTLFHLLRASAAIKSLSILGITLVWGSLFWIVVNGILFLMVRFNDRKAFQEG